MRVLLGIWLLIILTGCAKNDDTKLAMEKYMRIIPGMPLSQVQGEMGSLPKILNQSGSGLTLSGTYLWETADGKTDIIVEIQNRVVVSKRWEPGSQTLVKKWGQAGLIQKIKNKELTPAEAGQTVSEVVGPALAEMSHQMKDMSAQIKKGQQDVTARIQSVINQQEELIAKPQSDVMAIPASENRGAALR